MRKINYVTPKTVMPPFMVYPNFLVTADLTESAKLLYAELLSRARISMKNRKWIDAEGHVFSVYPQTELAGYLKKARSTIELLMRELESAGLIELKPPAKGRANLIYVKIPADAYKTACSASDVFPASPYGTNDSAASDSIDRSTVNDTKPMDRISVNDSTSVNTTGPILTDTPSTIDRPIGQSLTDIPVTNNTKNNKINNTNIKSIHAPIRDQAHKERYPGRWKEAKAGIERGKDLDTWLSDSISREIDEYRKKYPTKEERQYLFEQTLQHLRGLNAEV